jgi:alpha-L-fucosidase
MTRLSALLFLLLGLASAVRAIEPIPESAMPGVIVNTAAEPMKTGKFQPSWESLKQYRVPDWFRDAKFGIWACFGPQSEPEQGDWYARGLYQEGSAQNRYHVKHYGPPSAFGFKDVAHTWQARNFDPEKLVALYQRCGAQYFVAMANHHDNFDLYDSKYQPWNSVKVGPRKDIVGGFARAARAHGLPFGLSVHAAHAWTWYEAAQGADKTGPLAGVPYDGRLTKADGRGKWWNGLDPQDLYAQSHPPSVDFDKPNAIHPQWNFDHGSSLPGQAYCDRFYNRTLDLVHRYKPDLLYFDDNALPLWPVSDAGLKIAADFYNSNLEWHAGKLEAVLLGKLLTEGERQCLVWDIERGTANRIEPLPWQTDTCIGQWHYNRKVYDENGYKSAAAVVQTLADIVSKNGNLLLNIPVRADGTIDDKETAVLEGIGAWMKVNRECIFGTRPWKVFGEGPAAEAPPLDAKGMNESKARPFTADDIRFTSKNGALYAIVLGAPKKKVRIKALGTAAGLLDKSIGSIALLGGRAEVKWSQSSDALTITVPEARPNNFALVLKLALR